MGGSSKSSNLTTNNVTNYSLQGMESAETVVAGDNNTVTTTDHGAIAGAFGFGDSAMELGGKVVDANTDVAKFAISENGALVGQSIGLANTAMENTKDQAKSSLDFAETLVNQNSANTANSTLAIKDLAQSLASSGSSDVIEGSTKVVYTLGAVFAVVLLGFVLMMGSRRA